MKTKIKIKDKGEILISLNNHIYHIQDIKKAADSFKECYDIELSDRYVIIHEPDIEKGKKLAFFSFTSFKAFPKLTKEELKSP